MKDLLLLPGPTEVPERVARAGSKPMINHRGSTFTRLYTNIQDGLRPVFGTGEPVYLLPASGTGAMEAAVANLFSPGDRVLVGIMGAFGKRFADICQAFGLQVDRLEVEWGTQLTAGRLREALEGAGTGAYKGVLVTHNETSTGVLLDLEAVGKVVRASGALLVVDAVSGLGGAEMKMDEWGVDVVVTASQKALMTPPGLGLIAVSSNAWQAVEEARLPRFYWDLRQYKAFAAKNQTPATPPVSLLFALEEALAMISEEGLNHVYHRHRLMTRMLRAGIRALGLDLLANENVCSPTVTAIHIPDGIEPGKLIGTLRDRYGVIVAAGQGSLKDSIFRAGHMGSIQPGDLLNFLGILEKCLAGLGRGPSEGRAVAAASHVWEEDAE